MQATPFFSEKACALPQLTIIIIINPVLIQFFPRYQRWPNAPHSLHDRSHSFPPSRSICSFFDLQPDSLHTLFHLPLPCHFWPSSLSLSIHFHHHCVLQNIIIFSSNYMFIPSHSIRFAILSNVFFKPNISINSSVIFLFTNFTHTLTLPRLFKFFSKLPFHFPSNTMSHFHTTLLILHNFDKPSLSFLKKTFFCVTILRIL